MAKMAIDPGTMVRQNKVLKRPIDLTGINKVSILEKCPVGKSPSTEYSIGCTANRTTSKSDQLLSK